MLCIQEKQMEWLPSTKVAESFSSCYSTLTHNFTLKPFVGITHYAKQACFFNSGMKTTTTTKNNIYYPVPSSLYWLTGRKQMGTVIACEDASD